LNEKTFQYHHDLGVIRNPSVCSGVTSLLAFGLTWSKFCHEFYEVVVELLLHEGKALTHLRMHSMMVLKKSNDSPHLKLSKDAMINVIINVLCSFKAQSTAKNTSGYRILFLSPIVLGVARLMLLNEAARGNYI
jgi:hypothetical protein